MSMLFDVSPSENQARKKGGRLRKAAEATPAGKEPGQSPPLPPMPPMLSQAGPPLPLGTIDHTYSCPDTRCRAEFHDIVSEDGGDWLIQCGFCGTGQWVRAIKWHLKPRAEQFTFRDGRCQGLTLDGAAAMPRGLEYIAWAANEHPREAVRTACKSWLDSRRVAP